MCCMPHTLGNTVLSGWAPKQSVRFHESGSSQGLRCTKLELGSSGSWMTWEFPDKAGSKRLSLSDFIGTFLVPLGCRRGRAVHVAQGPEVMLAVHLVWSRFSQGPSWPETPQQSCGEWTSGLGRDPSCLIGSVGLVSLHWPSLPTELVADDQWLTLLWVPLLPSLYLFPVPTSLDTNPHLHLSIVTTSKSCSRNKFTMTIRQNVPV